MNPIFKNILAVLVGLFIGSCVNMGIIMLSGSIIPPPSGADVTTIEGLKANMHLFQPKYFLFPFLAHALGTLVASLIAVKIAGSHKIKIAFAIGFIFLIGGVTNVIMLPSPLWFSILDIIVAYIPMAFIGWKMTEKR